MIRTASAADLPRIRARMESVPSFWQAWWTDSNLVQAMRAANGLAFVWENNGRILGFVCAHDLGCRAYMSELVVEGGARGQGIAIALMKAVEEALRGKGQRVLIADVWRDAEGFYRSHGWDPPDAVLLRGKLVAKE